MLKCRVKGKQKKYSIGVHGVFTVEHVFRVIKCQFGYRKVRYQGLEKNEAQLLTLTALANIFFARKRLAAESA